jgi:sodium-coupled neutral amino acid transporter 11
VIRETFPALRTIPVVSLLTNRQFVIALCTACVSFPLSLHRSIDKLSRASALALASMGVIVCCVLVRAPQVPAELRGDPAKRFTLVGPGLVPAAGVISFAFVCHHNSMLIFGALRTPTLDRFARVTHTSAALALVACATLAVAAYSVFTDKTRGNVLNNFAPDDPWINLARFCFGLNMFTTLPLELFVCREVGRARAPRTAAHARPRRSSSSTFSRASRSARSATSSSPPRSCSRRRGVRTRARPALASPAHPCPHAVALVTCDLGAMLELTGGVSATAFAFVFPSVCYLSLAGRGRPWHARAKLPAAACAAFGGAVLVVSLVLGLRKAWSPEGDAKICV